MRILYKGVLKNEIFNQFMASFYIVTAKRFCLQAKCIAFLPGGLFMILLFYLIPEECVFSVGIGCLTFGGFY